MTGTAPAAPAGTAPDGTLSTGSPSVLASLLRPSAPGGGAGAAAEALARVRRRLASQLSSLGGELPGGEALVLDWFRLLLALRSPERCAEPDPGFRPTATGCRRAIGAAAAARCLGGGLPPGLAVEGVVHDALQEEPDRRSRSLWWAGWYRDLQPGARGVVRAEAVTWATHLLAAVDWTALGAGAEVGVLDTWWDCPGTNRLSLRGRTDVRVEGPDRPSVLVMANGTAPSLWQERLALSALVPGLARGARAVPTRVVGWWPASGQVRVLDVDAAALERMAERVVTAVATWVDGRLEAVEQTRREP